VSTQRSHIGRLALTALVLLLALVGVVLLAVLGTLGSEAGCTGSAPGAPASIALAPPGTGQLVAATEYGGPADPTSGTVGAMGVSLLAHPDSYAELGGMTFQTATAMGGLPYMTPLRITYPARHGHSAIAYKRDFGFGGAPIAGLPRVIDLWWQFAEALGLPYPWAGPVRIERPPTTGSAGVLGAGLSTAAGGPAAGCATAAPGGVQLTPGPRAQLLSDGQAAAPAGAPAAVKGMIAAGNQIAGKPYVYGGAHGLPLNQVAPSYDCSSSVAHLLYGGGLLPVSADPTSGTLESFGAPGPGRWVTIYASADHVFMYVAGLRWDTWNAAGPGDGSSGIGWHPLVRSNAGFVVRHPVGL
jgi:cell wall-associated NlpC family hydrolase